MMTRFWLVLLVGCGFFIGVILFRHYLPYAVEVTNMVTLGAEASLPTVESLYESAQADPLGAVRNGGIVTAGLGILSKGVSFLKSQLSVVRETTAMAKETRTQLSETVNGTVSEFNAVKEDLTKSTEELSTLKTEVAGLKEQNQAVLSDFSSLKTEYQTVLDENAKLRYQLEVQNEMLARANGTVVEKVVVK